MSATFAPQEEPRAGSSKNSKIFQLRCEVCHEEFEDTFRLKVHTMSRHSSKDDLVEIRCKFCSEIFLSEQVCTDHELQVHGISPSFQCQVCLKSYSSQKTLKMHSFVHKRGNHLTCKFCGKKFTYKTRLKSHIKNHHSDEDPVSSEEEDATIVDTKEPSEEKNDEKNETKDDSYEQVEDFFDEFQSYEEPYVYDDVQYGDENNEEALEVQDDFTNDLDEDFPEPFANDVEIPKESKRKTRKRKSNSKQSENEVDDDLEAILNPDGMLQRPKKNTKRTFMKMPGKGKTDFNTPKKDRTCNQCGKVLQSVEYLQHHIRTKHEKKTDFQCEKCDNKYSSYSSLYRHNLKVHEKEEIKCETCNKTYYNRFSYQDHMNRVHQQKVEKSKRFFECPFCQERFPDEDGLFDHKSAVHEIQDENSDFDESSDDGGDDSFGFSFLSKFGQGNK